MCLAIPGLLKSICEASNLENHNYSRTGVVDFGGTSRVVNISCLPDAKVGDYIIVHAGVGLQILDEVEACKTLSLLQQ